MAKTKYFVKKGPQMANFLCIFVRNLKWMAPPEYCPKNPEFFWWLPTYIHSSGKIFRKNINFFENLEQAPYIGPLKVVRRRTTLPKLYRTICSNLEGRGGGRNC